VERGVCVESGERDMGFPENCLGLNDFRQFFIFEYF
jgi:hypothetical protein